MNGWQNPNNNKRLYIVPDNSPLREFGKYISNQDLEMLFKSSGESQINLGIHYYNNQLYSSNYVGICRLKKNNGEKLYDFEGNELILQVVPRFNITVVELLNYIRDDDEFDRYMAPQTTSNMQRENSVETIERNEIFHFFENEEPLKVDDGISNENSIMTVTAYLSLLKSLCRRPLMGRMMNEEKNLNGKIKGKIVVEKNIRKNALQGRNDRFFCKYLHYTDDIIENQILKAALIKSKRFLSEYFGNIKNGNNNYYSTISYCSKALRSIKEVQCKGSSCNGLRFSGCYTYYKPVITMAKMILDGISIESNGAVSNTGYIIPYAISMEKLFEVYVRAYLKKNGIHSYKSKYDHGIVLSKYDNKTEVFAKEDNLPNPGEFISGSIKPDIILTQLDSGRTTVLDVKYKDYAKSYSRDDRLQLLAYSLMLNADDIGIILPAHVDEEIFDPRKINSLEDRSIKYHQMLLGINKGNTSVADYIKSDIFGKSEYIHIKV